MFQLKKPTKELYFNHSRDSFCMMLKLDVLAQIYFLGAALTNTLAQPISKCHRPIKPIPYIGHHPNAPSQKVHHLFSMRKLHPQLIHYALVHEVMAKAVVLPHIGP